ncbi:hypothetical protein [Candidatus Nitrospira bockiana]
MIAGVALLIGFLSGFMLSMLRVVFYQWDPLGFEDETTTFMVLFLVDAGVTSGLVGIGAGSVQAVWPRGATESVIAGRVLREPGRTPLLILAGILRLFHAFFFHGRLVAAWLGRHA